MPLITYGEDTKLSPTVREAHLTFTLLPSQRQALCEARLLIVNESISQPIEASLTFPLPTSDAVVCGFRVGPDEAIAVPKAKVRTRTATLLRLRSCMASRDSPIRTRHPTQAAEVAYKEREKGRAVATARNVQASVWETTVFPLPQHSPVEVVVQCVCDLAAAADGPEEALALHLPLILDTEADVRVSARVADGSLADVVISAPANLCGRSTLPDGVRLSVPLPPAASTPPICAAIRERRLVWSGCVPAETIEAALPASPASPAVDLSDADGAVRFDVALIIDSSRSASALRDPTAGAVEALAASIVSIGAQPTFSVWRLSRSATQLGSHLPLADTLAALAALRYDGGTDLSQLDGILCDAASAGAGRRLDPTAAGSCACSLRPAPCPLPARSLPAPCPLPARSLPAPCPLPATAPCCLLLNQRSHHCAAALPRAATLPHRQPHGPTDLGRHQLARIEAAAPPAADRPRNRWRRWQWPRDPSRRDATSGRGRPAWSAPLACLPDGRVGVGAPQQARRARPARERREPRGDAHAPRD